MSRTWRTEAEKQAFFLTKKVDEAIRDHDMIREGDRILVGLSGGKDSLSLLRLLKYRQAHATQNYEIVAAHVRGDARGIVAGPPPELAEWVMDEGVEFHMADLNVNDNEPLPMNCERCSRARRRTLFEIAQSCACNKIALGHNLEDFAATALMNLFSSGRLDTMAFKRAYFDDKFTVIRPLAYLREKDLVKFARTCELPVVPAECPLAGTSRRASARDLMRLVAHDFRHASENIVKAAISEGTEDQY